MWNQDDLCDLARNTFWGAPVTIEHLRGTLKANLHLPPQALEQNADARFPCVLLLHGLGGTRFEHNGLFVKAASALALNGLAALRVDFRGAGETGGSTRDLTLTTQVEDASDALDHLREYDFVDQDRVAVLGLSFGGLTAACLAAQRPDVSALVLWEAAYDMKATMKRLFGGMSLKAVRARGYVQVGLLELSTAFFDALEGLDLDALNARYDRPVLVVQGVEDACVPVDTAYQWKRSFIATDADVHLIAGADHCFTQEPWSWEAINVTIDWLKEHLSPAQ